MRQRRSTSVGVRQLSSHGTSSTSAACRHPINRATRRRRGSGARIRPDNRPMTTTAAAPSVVIGLLRDLPDSASRMDSPLRAARTTDRLGGPGVRPRYARAGCPWTFPDYDGRRTDARVQDDVTAIDATDTGRKTRVARVHTSLTPAVCIMHRRRCSRADVINCFLF